MRHRIVPLLVVAAACSVLVTCGDTTGVVPVTRVTVTGRSALRVGETVSFTARAFAATGDGLRGVVFTWSSSDEAVATVDDSGVVTTLLPGSTEISAAVGNINGRAVVTVTLVPVIAVEITTSRDTVLISDSLSLSVVLRDSAGGVLAGRPIAWLSSDTTKATVSPAGVVRPRRAGGLAVEAVAEGRRDGLFLTVLDPVEGLLLPDSFVVVLSDTVELAALLEGPGGHTARARPLTWSVGDPTVATIVGELLQPRRYGRTPIRASCCGGLADTAWLVVTGLPAQSVEWPLPPALVAGRDMLLQAFPRDAAGRLTLGATWYTSDSTIVTIEADSSGDGRAMVHPVRPGLVTLAVRAGTAETSHPARVYPLSRALRLDPDTLVIGVGDLGAQYTTAWHASGAQHPFSPTVSFRVLDTTVAAVVGGAPFPVRGRQGGQTRLIGSGDVLGTTYEDTTVVVVRAASPARLSWVRPASMLDTAQYITVPVTLSLTDSAGLPIGGLGDAILVSQDTAVAQVSPSVVPALSGQVSVNIAPRRPGVAIVTATVDSLVAVLLVRATGPSIGVLHFTPPSILTVGDSVDLQLLRISTLTHQPLDYPVTWSSSDTTVAVVRGLSLLVARSPGRAFIEVRSGGLWQGADVVVRTASGPTLGPLPPLAADSAAVIAGTGFDPVPTNNAVTVDGVPVAVLAATTTRLDLRLPPPEAFVCGPTARSVVTVATPSGMAADSVILTRAHAVILPVGGSVRLAGTAATRCLELPALAANYLVTVTNRSTTLDATAAFVLEGRPSAEPAPAPPPAAGSARTPVAGSARTPAVAVSQGLAVVAGWREQRQRHVRVLADGQRFARLRGDPRPLLRERRLPMRSVGDSLGRLVRFRVPRVDRPDLCAAYLTITARRVVATSHLLVFVDTTTADSAAMDQAVAALAAEFEGAMYPVLLEHFGNPLAMDTLLDRNGRMTVLVSPAINGFAAGFVTACDFYPETVAPSSNTGETIYLAAPQAPAGFPGGPRAFWLWQFRSVLMHEAKHVTAVAARLLRGAPPEDVWLEEGTAVIAEELWARSLYGTTWRSNAGYQATLFCDVRPGWPECPRSAFAVFGAFLALYDFANAAGGEPRSESHSPLGPVDWGDGSFYGSAWWLLRWVLDTYAITEGAFLRSLVEEPVLSGVANLEARAGRSMRDLVGDWMVASVSDGRYTLPAPWRVASWETQAVFSGMAADFPDDFGLATFEPRGSYGGTPAIPITNLRGGSASVFDISAGSYQRQQLQLLDTLGFGPRASLDLMIVRRP